VGGFVKGSVVVINFPFSDLSGAKRRPALVIADLDGDDIILCQITRRSTGDRYAITLKSGDFENGALSSDSTVRPNKIFTADKGIILYTVGRVDTQKMDEVIRVLSEIISF